MKKKKEFLPSIIETPNVRQQLNLDSVMEQNEMTP